MPERLDRREALRRAAMAGSGAMLASRWATARGEAQPARRPNIVFILIDDLRWDAFSCLGHPFVQTPHIDRIANEGARFHNAFVTISLCSPSRGCFLTGTYAHTHNVRTNETSDYDPRLRNFGQVLQAEGYETAFVGKWHMAPTAQPRPGFDYWLSFRGQGEHLDPALNENGRDFQATGYMTDLLTDYAVKWLEGDRTRPFCLYLSHKAVHGPCIPADRHKDALPDAELPEPPSFKDDFAGKPEWIRAGFVRGARREDVLKNRDKPVPQSIPPGVWDPKSQGRLDYYRMILSVDESVGRVLQTLEKQGVLDDTIVVFTSDNGYFMGEHRRGDKRLMYEDSIRIPLFIRYPRTVRAGAAPQEMALNIDLAPTLLDMAGAPTPPEVQGASLRPLLEGRPTTWRESWLYEYFQEGWLPGIATMFGVRTADWKYITYPDLDDLDELYDLRSDPHELRNLAQDPAHAGKLAEMQAELERLLKATDYAPAPKPHLQEVETKLLAAYTFGEGAGTVAKSTVPGPPDGAIRNAT